MYDLAAFRERIKEVMRRTSPYDDNRRPNLTDLCRSPQRDELSVPFPKQNEDALIPRLSDMPPREQGNATFVTVLKRRRKVLVKLLH